METSEHLEKAPIMEAIIDIRHDSNIDIKLIKSLDTSLPPGYSEFTPTVKKNVGLAFKQGSVETKHEEFLIGYRSDNDETGYVIQFQSDGITVSKLAPYANWEDFKKEAMLHWEIYKSILGNYKFARLAVRYINQFELPFTDGKVDLDQYLTNCPKVPKSMPDILLNFLCKIVVPYQDIDALAVITLNLGDPKIGSVPVILDIDVYRDQNLNFTENEIWSFFEHLRRIKNKAFFGSVHKNALELFK